MTNTDFNKWISSEIIKQYTLNSKCEFKIHPKKLNFKKGFSPGFTIEF